MTRLDQNGSVLWTKLIDSGNVDYAQSIIQTADGGFVVSGGTTKPFCNNGFTFPNTPRLSRLSDNGDILWSNDYPGSFEGMVGVAENSEGNLISVSDHGTFYLISPDGGLNHSYSFGAQRAFVETTNGNLVLVGKTFVKLDKNLSSQQFQNKTFDNRNDELVYSLLINVTPFSPFQYSPSRAPIVQFYQNGYNVLYLNEISLIPTFVDLDKYTRVRSNVSLSNMSTFYVPTEDGGYTFLKNVQSEDKIEKTHLSPGGLISWVSRDSCTHCPKTEIIPLDARQTEDGGYIYIYGVKKERNC